MLRWMRVAVLREQGLVALLDAGWLVDGELFTKREMHAHVQEGVGLAVLRRVVTIYIGRAWKEARDIRGAARSLPATWLRYRPPAPVLDICARSRKIPDAHLRGWG